VVALASALEDGGCEVVVACPATNMSGAAAAIGPIDPKVPVRKVAIPAVYGPAFAVAAPPAMIVIAAMNGAFGRRPTAVASGVNAGVNLGRAILHSGTVGAAMTGHNLGLRAVAVSVQPGGDVDVAATWGVRVLRSMAGERTGRMANVNVPKQATVDTRCVETRLASYGAVSAAMVGDALDFRLTIDPELFAEEGTDGVAIRDGLVAVTWLDGFTDELIKRRPREPARVVAAAQSRQGDPTQVPGG
jgi:5'-nucleotidase